MTTVRYVIPGVILDAAREADRTCAPGAAFAAARRVFAFLPREDPGVTGRRYAELAAHCGHIGGRPWLNRSTGGTDDRA